MKAILIMVFTLKALALHYRFWKPQFQTGSIAVTSVGVAPIALNYATTYATKQNAGCQLAISICKLNSAFETSTPNYGRYSVIAKIVSSSQTGLTISTQTLLPTNNIVSLQIRYLSMDPSFFVYATIVYLQLDTRGAPLTYSSSVSRAFPISSVSSSAYSVYTEKFISGIDIQQPSSVNEQISLTIGCSLTGSSLTCFYYSALSASCKAYFVSIYAFVFYWGYMESDIGYSLTYFGPYYWFDPTANSADGSETVTPYDSTVSFYGFSNITKMSSGQTSLEFAMYHTGPSLYHIDFGGYSNGVTYQITLTQFIIYFYTEFNCPSGTIYLTSLNICKPCAIAMYFDTSLGSCRPCTGAGCLLCTATACTLCSSTYVLSGTTCFSCSSLNSNCVTCTNSTCLSCVDPYVVNGTACFLCSALDSQCNNCTATQCLICADPYMPNGTKCILCTDLDPHCDTCNASECFNCSSPYLANGTTCFLCSVFDTNCIDCTPYACLNCSSSYGANGTTCFPCNMLDPHCGNCTVSACIDCYAPYIQNGTTCFLCSDLDSNCLDCTPFACLNCSSSYGVNGTSCFLCSVLFANCEDCNISACTNCTSPYLLNVTTCFLCSDLDTNCLDCTPYECLNCSLSYGVNGTVCFLCSQFDPNCLSCNSSACIECMSPYQVNGTACFLCTDLDSNCADCTSLACLNCTYPYEINGTACFLCSDLDTNCVDCTPFACLNCSDPYVVNGTVCFLCTDLDSNCLQCTPFACLNCSDPYVVNGTACFLCTYLDTNCVECTPFACLNCMDPYVVNGTTCFLCSDLDSHCVDCTPLACLNCSDPYAVNGTTCFLCSDLNSHCVDCTPLACLSCADPYVVNGTACFLCTDIDPHCANCTNMGCTICMEPQYWLNGSSCDVNCTNIDPQCTSCSDAGGVIHCLSCSAGYVVQNSISCVPVCGDGIVIANSQQCDDNNNENGDGCSSSCTIEKYFSCVNPVNQSSDCKLTSLDMTVISTVKSESANEFTMTIELGPPNLPIYQQAGWQSAFQNASAQLNCMGAVYDPIENRLRVTFSYNQNIQGNALTINASSLLASQYFSNVSSSLLSLPLRTSNNQALIFYSDNVYSMAKIVKWLSMAVAALSLLLFFAGYFGAKLPGLEGAAVVQLAALLLFTVDNTAPTYDGLKYLGWSLGATPFFRKKSFYEDTKLPYTVRSQLGGNDFFSTFNVFLAVIVIPLLLAVVLKILAGVACKDSILMQRVWKNSLGTYTFYGMLFLAYGYLSLLTIDAKYFSAEISCYIGISVGGTFLLSLIAYVIGLQKLPEWFGSFKKRFIKNSICSHFYLFSSVQRLITSAVIACLCPGIFAPAALVFVFLAQLLFNVIKRPYVQGQWKRPFLNKFVSICLCGLFVGASLTDSSSAINQMIPLAVLVLLLVTLICTTIVSIMDIRQRCKKLTQTDQQQGKQIPHMALQQSHRALLRNSICKRIIQHFPADPEGQLASLESLPSVLSPTHEQNIEGGLSSDFLSQIKMKLKKLDNTEMDSPVQLVQNQLGECLSELDELDHL